MTWRSDFNCDRAQFSTGSLEQHELTDSEDQWQPVKVFVNKLSDNKRWLMVTLAAAGEPVIVWRAIQEGWTVACDESSMTMFLRHAGTESVKGTVEKLRFVARKDYWSFVAQYASSRVQAYTGAWAAEDTTTDPTLTVYSETMESAS